MDGCVDRSAELSDLGAAVLGFQINISTTGIVEKFYQDCQETITPETRFFKVRESLIYKMQSTQKINCWRIVSYFLGFPPTSI